MAFSFGHDLDRPRKKATLSHELSVVRGMRVELESETSTGGSRSLTSSTMDELYALHVARAVRLAYLMTGEREASEDIAQDAFIRVFGRWRHLRRRESFEAYLRKAVINGARSHLRRRGVEKRFVAREAGLRPDETGEPSGLLDGRLREVLLSLPPRQRAVVVLRYYEDLSEDQVATLLGCSRGNVKSLASKGMARLREVLSDGDEL
jgi:RNA polymerase sigma-70 factor (sigma-E family)